MTSNSTFIVDCGPSSVVVVEVEFWDIYTYVIDSNLPNFEIP